TNTPFPAISKIDSPIRLASSATSFAALRLHSYALRNVPDGQPNAGSQATIHVAKSAMRGQLSSRVVGKFFSPQTTASRSAPRVRDHTFSNSRQKSASFRRFFLGIIGNSTGIQRSIKSLRVAISVIPFRVIARSAEKIFSSSSPYNSRVAKPPPVASRQRSSLNQVGNPLTLSSATSQELDTAI